MQVALFQLRGFAQQAVGGKQVQETDFLLVDAHRFERVQVQGADLDIFHAALLQSGGGALALVDGALGADRGVVLVFDLQDVGIQLAIVVAHLYADLFVGRFRRLDGVGQGGHILVQIVVADRQGRLGIVLVAQVAHAQAGGVGFEQGVIKGIQLVLATGQEGFAQGR